MKHFLVGCFVLLFASLCSAQYEVKVTTIDVWVKVTDKSGQAITGLKQEDFQLSEDGQAVQSTCFEESVTPKPSTGAATTPDAALPELPAKKFVIFLDLYNTSQPEFLYIKTKLLDFVKRFSSGNREIMLAGIRPDRNMGIFSPFTTDSSKIVGLIDQAQGNAVRDRNNDNHENDLRRTLTSAAGNTKAPDEGIRAAYQLADGFAKEDAEVTKFSLNALAKFATWLAKQSQTEHSIVLYVSGGFSVDPGRHYFDIVDRYTEDHREEIENPDITIFREGINFDFHRTLEESIGRMNRLNITLYTINTRGLIISDPDISKSGVTRTATDIQTVKEYGDSLDVIAQETGGTSFSNSQNFKLGFNNVVQDLDHQYLLCYNAPEHKETDKYHKIIVKVNRPDADVRHRNGYLD